jgi:molybdenum cofactor biosynthesis protein MoaC
MFYIFIYISGQTNEGHSGWKISRSVPNLTCQGSQLSVINSFSARLVQYSLLSTQGRHLGSTCHSSTARFSTSVLFPGKSVVDSATMNICQGIAKNISTCTCSYSSNSNNGRVSDHGTGSMNETPDCDNNIDGGKETTGSEMEIDGMKYWEMDRRQRLGVETSDCNSFHGNENGARSGMSIQTGSVDQTDIQPDASSPSLTHTDSEGRAVMVDVGNKPDTERVAIATATIYLGETAFHLVRDNKIKKGDVLTVAQIAGVMAAKRTGDLVPLCHTVVLSSVQVALRLVNPAHAVVITATAKTSGMTGVEMEAIVAATTAAITVYDMCKAVTRDMVIGDVRLLSKTGGQRGDYPAKQV